jgi:hypothetical protein
MPSIDGHDELREESALIDTEIDRLKIDGFEPDFAS